MFKINSQMVKNTNCFQVKFGYRACIITPSIDNNNFNVHHKSSLCNIMKQLLQVVLEQLLNFKTTKIEMF